MASSSKARKGGPSSSAPNQGKGGAPLSLRYPVNSTWEFTLNTEDQQTAEGTVYCTDETSQMIVLQKSLPHTTLTFEVRMVQVASIKEAKLISSSTENSANTGDASLSKPLPVVERKVLEEREKRAIRLAEESYRHINQNATAEGQAIFDRLLKACNEVTWEGKSILVLGQIQVDPPYGQEDCRIVSKGSGAEGSLDRVKKIVAAAGSGGY